MPFSFIRKNPFDAPKVRVIFMGTPEFAETFLQALIQAKYDVVAVFTQPDKPQGRNQELLPSPVKTLALGNRIPVEQPTKINEESLEKVRTLKPDLIVVAAYGKILPQALLDIPRFGCINVHPSLLPKYRGASPIQNALMNGETETGVTIMKMDAGMDTGDILSQKTVPIDPIDTAPTLEKRLAREGVELLIETLPLWIDQTLKPKPQNNTEATLCELIEREDGRIFWSEAAAKIYNLYRAFQPWPGLFSYWKKKEDAPPIRIKLLSLSVQEENPEQRRHLGEVFRLGERIGIQTGSGVIFPEIIQLEGKEPAHIQEFIKGYPSFIGSVLE